jgi:hypothetical protein
MIQPGTAALPIPGFRIILKSVGIANNNSKDPKCPLGSD